MADDIVNRLRNVYCDHSDTTMPCGVCVACKAADEIERLRAELDSQTQWAELLAGNNCHCIPDDVGVCLPCAYRQTMRQNLEAHRG